MNYFLVMPAAGSGRRFQGDVPKQYAPLMGRTVIEWALAPFLGDERCAHAVVVIAEADSIWPRVAARLAPERVSATPGGVERSDSVRRGLGKLAGRAAALDWVLVHDAARPCLEPADLARLISRVTDADRGGLLAAPAADTLKQAREASERAESPAVARTIDRSGLASCAPRCRRRTPRTATRATKPRHSSGAASIRCSSKARRPTSKSPRVGT